LSLSPCPRRSTDTPREMLGLRGEERAIASPAVHEDKGGFAGTTILKCQLCVVAQDRRHAFLHLLSVDAYDVEPAISARAERRVGAK
jgi:hypothetical protein